MCSYAEIDKEFEEWFKWNQCGEPEYRINPKKGKSMMKKQMIDELAHITEDILDGIHEDIMDEREAEEWD